MIKTLLLIGFLLGSMFIRKSMAQQTDAKTIQVVEVYEGIPVDWSKIITYERMFGDENELAPLHSWEVIRDRIAEIDRALQSPIATSSEKEQFTEFKKKLLALELKFLDGAAADKKLIIGDKEAENKRLEKIETEKKFVSQAINELK